MSKATKITYAILSILAGLTVGVLVALIVGVITTFQALIKCPDYGRLGKETLG